VDTRECVAKRYTKETTRSARASSRASNANCCIAERVGTKRSQDKDALDIYRFLRAFEPRDLAVRFARLRAAAVSTEPTDTAVAEFELLFGSPRAAGIVRATSGLERGWKPQVAGPPLARSTRSVAASARLSTASPRLFPSVVGRWPIQDASVIRRPGRSATSWVDYGEAARSLPHASSTRARPTQVGLAARSPHQPGQIGAPPSSSRE
jgi:hypothetical protein